MRNTGEFGNFSCDSPWSLAESAIMAMAAAEPEPDLILVSEKLDHPYITHRKT